MSSTTTDKPDFVPVASYVAFAFIGAVMVIGLIGRCLAMNHSTIGTHSHDLMIYQAAPKPVLAPKTRRLSTDQKSDSNGDIPHQKQSSEDQVTAVRVQRGPKNL